MNLARSVAALSRPASPAAARRRLALAAAAVVSVGHLAAGSAWASKWTGFGTTANWSNAANWAGFDAPDSDFPDSISFDGVNTRTTSVVDQSYIINSLQFTRGDLGEKDAFTLNATNGAVLTVGRPTFSGISNFTDLTQTINVPLVLRSGVQVYNADTDPDGNGVNNNGGTIRVNGSLDLRSYTLNVQPRAQSSIEFNGAVVGSGGIINGDAASSGTLVLGGGNDFTGGLQIRNGTVRFSSGANLGSRVNIVSFDQYGASLPTLRRTASGTTVSAFQLVSGTAVLYADADWTHTGTITGTGLGNAGLAKDGQAALTLTNTLAYGGDTAIKAGTLVLGGSARLPDTTNVTISLNAGGLTYGGNMSDTIKSLNGFGTLTLGYGTRLTTGGGVYGGLVTGPGDLAVNNNGTFTLSNTNNDYTGGTTVAGGASLALTNATGNSTGTGRVLLESGARLSGYGRGNATIVVNGGTDAASGFASIVSPNGTNGALAGTLTVGGLDFDGRGASVRIDVDGGQGGTTIDRLAVTGNADLREGSLELLRRGSNFFPNLGLSPTAVVTSGSRTGVFASVAGVRVTDTLSFAVTYDGSNVNIRLADAADPNLDGSRTFADFLVLAPTYRTGATDQIWVTGDVTGDGLTDLADLTLLSNLHAEAISESQYETLRTASQQEWFDLRTLRGLPVPEPTAAAVVAPLAAFALRRRRAI